MLRRKRKKKTNWKWFWQPRMTSWFLISHSVIVAWNNTQGWLSLPALLPVALTGVYSSPRSRQLHQPATDSALHSFVSSHMHSNKRIRYQGKLMYSNEDGVPTVCRTWNIAGADSRHFASLRRQHTVLWIDLLLCVWPFTAHAHCHDAFTHIYHY